MGTVRVKVSAGTKYIGSTDSTVLEFDSVDWEDMSDEEKEEACQEAMYELIEWYWEVI